MTNEISIQRKEYTENIKFRLSSESGVEAQNRELDKLKQKIEYQQMLLSLKRRDPEKQKLIDQLEKERFAKRESIKVQNETTAAVTNELRIVKAKNIVAKRIFDDRTEKWNKHLADLEDKESLEHKIGSAKDSIETLKKNIEKLLRLRNKLSSRDKETELILINQMTNNLMRNNVLLRNTITLENESLNTGQALVNLLEDARKLIARNNIIADKLPITLGIKKDDYIQAIVNQFIKQEQFLVDDEKVEFSKASVAYFFRIFIVEVKVSEIIEVLTSVIEDFYKNKESLQKHQIKMQTITIEELTPAVIDEAYLFNEEIRNKMVQYRAKTKEFNEIFQLQKIGVDRFQEKIRSKCVQQVKERQKVPEILTKNGITRVAINNSTLMSFYGEVEKLLKVNWLQHKINYFTDFKKKVLGLNDENNALTGNLHILKLILEKAKLKQLGVEGLDIQKISKLVQSLNIFLDSAIKDHDTLQDIEKRISELQLQYDKIIEQVCDDAKDHLKEVFTQKCIQSNDLSIKDEDLMKYLDQKISDLYNIKSNVDENDKDMQQKFQVFELQLAEANLDEEHANDQQRQIQSKIDRLQKQFLRIIPIQLKDITQCSSILDSLNNLDQHIKNTEQLIKDAYKKVQDFDENFKKLEDQIRNKRIKDSDKSLQVAFSSLEKLIKILEKHYKDVNIASQDQRKLINNKFEDQEKYRDTNQFGREIETKVDDLGEYSKKKDAFKVQLDSLRAEYQDKLTKRETSSGLEFQKIKNESDRINSNILQQISILEGPVTEETNQVKETNKTLLQKYSYKQEKHSQCLKLRNIKTEEFQKWLQTLHDMEQRQESLEMAIKDIGYTSEYAKLYLSLVQRVAKNKQKALDLDNQVSNNSKILIVEASDLDYLFQKIIKNLRLDEIYKLLEQMNITFDGYDDILDDIDKELKKLEKDVEDFMNKLRGSQYNDVYNKLRKLENSLEKLNEKLREVDNESRVFKIELQSNGSELKNKHTVQEQFNVLDQEAEKIKDQRDEITRLLEILKIKFQKLDKKNLSIQDCEQIMNEADKSDVDTNKEYDYAVVVLDKIRKLLMKFREINKAESERQKLIQKAKDGIKNNKDQLKNMKQLLQQILEKTNDFEILYKAMLASEDYSERKDNIEKKLFKVRAIREETQKYMKLREQMDETLTQYSDQQIEQINDLVVIEAIIEKNEKISDDVKQYNKIIMDMGRSLDNRRIKTSDAEIRKNINKHLKVVDDLSKVLANQVEMLDTFEKHVLASIQDEQEQSKNKILSPEAIELQKILENLKNQMSDFKVKFSNSSVDIKNLAKEIKDTDLENIEPLPNMAKYIERLSKIANNIKILKGDSDSLQKQIEDNAGMLGSMDIDKKLKRLLDMLINAQKIKDTMDAIKRIIDLTDSYNGYTSNNEDEGFFTNMNTDSKSLLEDLQRELAQFEQLEIEIRQIIEELEFMKQKNNGNIDTEQQDNINNTIDKVKVVYRKSNDNKVEIDNNAISNKDKTANHQLEQKVMRRKDELEDIDRVCQDNLISIIDVKNIIDDEVTACSNNDTTLQKYVSQLKARHTELDKLTTQVNQVYKVYKNIAIDNEQLGNEINLVNNEPVIRTNKRLDYFDQHLIIKKRLNHAKKENPHDIFGRKIRSLLDEIQEIMSKKPVKAAYKCVAGDDIDKMIADMMIKSGEQVDLKRLGGGFYMFGSKKIYCKVMNSKLVVRVGGGYVSIEEFIKLYAKGEIQKKKNADELIIQFKEAKDDQNSKAGDKSNKNNKKNPDILVEGRGGENIVTMASVKNMLKK